MFYAKRNGKAVPITPPTIEDAQVPVGTVLHYAGAEAPDGWMICDGRELDAEEYESLFEAVGYTYGGSNGKFKLPDFRETAAVGVGDRGLSSSVAYKLGEFKNDQLQSHTHAQASHTHTSSAHCHPTAVCHTHSINHCHCLPTCYKMGAYSTNAQPAQNYVTETLERLECYCQSSMYFVNLCASGTFTSGSYAAHYSGATTAVNCPAGASTGTRGRRIALNFIIYTGGTK